MTGVDNPDELPTTGWAPSGDAPCERQRPHRVVAECRGDLRPRDRWDYGETMCFRHLLCAVLAVGLLATGCGDDEADRPAPPAAEETAPRDPEPEPQDPQDSGAVSTEETGGAEFTGQDRQNYEKAKSFCGSASPEEIARAQDLRGIRGETVEERALIAGAYAAAKRGNRQAWIKGCLDGFGDAK